MTYNNNNTNNKTQINGKTTTLLAHKIPGTKLIL